MSDQQAPSYLWHPHGPGFVTQAEQTLRVSAWCTVAGVTLTIAAVVIDQQGCPRPHLNVVLPTSDRLKTSPPPFALEEGQIASVQVFASAGAPIGSQCFVRVELLQGREGGTISLGTVLEGYVTANVALAYPGDNTSRPVDGNGTPRIVLGAAPAAGAEFIVTVPANTRWSLISVAYALIASAAVANRQPFLAIDDGVNEAWETFNATNITAAQTAFYRAGAGVQLATIAALDFQLPLPETMALPAGARIKSSTTALQAGDQYTAPVLNVIEWLDV